MSPMNFRPMAVDRTPGFFEQPVFPMLTGVADLSFGLGLGLGLPGTTPMGEDMKPKKLSKKEKKELEKQNKEFQKAFSKMEKDYMNNIVRNYMEGAEAYKQGLMMFGGGAPF